jgi:hypothetical protein
MAKASRSALLPHAADVPNVCGEEKIMGYANIHLQDQTIKIQTVPGSGFIKVFLPAIQYSFYNPATGLFSTTRPDEVFVPLMAEPQLQELKQQLNAYDAARREAISAANQRSSKV